MAALQAAARDLGYSPAVAGMVEGGETGLVQYFVDKCNAKLASSLAAIEAESAAGGAAAAALTTEQRVLRGARLRLEMLEPYLGAGPAGWVLRFAVMRRGGRAAPVVGGARRGANKRMAPAPVALSAPQR